MGSKKVQKITRTIKVASTSWATNVLTITCTAAPGLVAGDVISFTDTNFPTVFTAAITGVAGNDITVACTDKNVKPESIVTNIWNNGATGAQEVFTWGWGAYPSGLVQVTTNASGTVSVKVEGSVDGVKWEDAAGAQSIVADSTYIFQVTKPYAYGRLNFTVAVGGAGGKVTAVRTVA